MSKKPYADHLVWLDLETTGTDEHADHILEVGITVTQPVFPFDERDRFESIVIPVMPRAGDLSWVDNLDPVVLDMHTKNGLLQEVREAQMETNGFLYCITVEARILDFLAPYGKRLLLAGSGVGHFDRRFIRRQMPTLDDRLLFPCLDVGIIRRTMALLGRDDLMSHDGEANDLKPHRALADALIHLDEYRHYCGLFLDIGKEEVETETE